MSLKKVNILGDSITWGYSPINGEELDITYANILKKKLNLQELNNYGVNGSTLADGENAFEPMVLRYKQMVDDADLVIVFGGTNDYDPISEKPIILGDKNEKSQETIYGALHEICQGLKNKYPEAKIFFITPLKRAYEVAGKLKYNVNIKNCEGYTLEDVGMAIKEVCKMHDIDVFDLYDECEIFSTEECLKYLPDGLHPTEEYHEILADKILEFISKNIWEVLNE